MCPCTARRRAVAKNSAVIYRPSYCGARLAQELHCRFCRRRLTGPRDRVIFMALALRAGFVYFALIFAAGFILGTLRIFVILPRFGPSLAVLIGLPVILAICWFGAKWIVEKFAVPAVVADRLAMGVIAFVFLILAETILATAGFGRTLTGFLRSFATPEGAIGFAGQMFFALFPYLLLRRSAVDD